MVTMNLTSIVYGQYCTEKHSRILFVTDLLFIRLAEALCCIPIHMCKPSPCHKERHAVVITSFPCECLFINIYRYNISFPYYCLVPLYFKPPPHLREDGCRQRYPTSLWGYIMPRDTPELICGEIIRATLPASPASRDT